MLCITSVAMGMLTVMTQIIIPLAADLTDPKDQGKTIGMVMSGMLMFSFLSLLVLTTMRELHLQYES